MSTSDNLLFQYAYRATVGARDWRREWRFFFQRVDCERINLRPSNDLSTPCITHTTNTYTFRSPHTDLCRLECKEKCWRRENEIVRSIVDILMSPTSYFSLIFSFNVLLPKAGIFIRFQASLLIGRRHLSKMRGIKCREWRSPQWLQYAWSKFPKVLLL